MEHLVIWWNKSPTITLFYKKKIGYSCSFSR